MSLESPGLENIPQVPGNRAEVGQNYDGRKAVSATPSLLSELELYFGPEAQKSAFKKFCCVHFTSNEGRRGSV